MASTQRGRAQCRGRARRHGADPADLRTAIDLRTSHWIAPDIPTAILDSIDRERLGELGGGWGEPGLGEPIQIDVIRLETPDEPVDIEVFNRAIGRAGLSSRRTGPPIPSTISVVPRLDLAFSQRGEAHRRWHAASSDGL
jgi:hypothetical protein